MRWMLPLPGVALLLHVACVQGAEPSPNRFDEAVQKLELKQAQLESLQSEVDRLRAEIGRYRVMNVEVKCLEVSLTRAKELGIDLHSATAERLHELVGQNVARVYFEQAVPAASGKLFSVNSGGEFPVLTRGPGGVSVEYKKHGVGLELLALLPSENFFRLKTTFRVAEIDESGARYVNDMENPALITHEMASSLDGKPGDQFVVWGSKQKRAEATVGRESGPTVHKEVETQFVWLLSTSKVMETVDAMTEAAAKYRDAPPSAAADQQLQLSVTMVRINLDETAKQPKEFAVLARAFGLGQEKLALEASLSTSAGEAEQVQDALKKLIQQGAATVLGDPRLELDPGRPDWARQKTGERIRRQSNGVPERKPLGMYVEAVGKRKSDGRLAFEGYTRFEETHDDRNPANQGMPSPLRVEERPFEVSLTPGQTAYYRGEMRCLDEQRANVRGRKSSHVYRSQTVLILSGDARPPLDPALSARRGDDASIRR